jgi:hypothetical protein
MRGEEKDDERVEMIVETPRPSLGTTVGRIVV